MAAAFAASLLALLALASAVVPSPAPTAVGYTSSTSTSSLGVAGSPSVRTLYFSYYSNWQFVSGDNTLTNANFNVLRACHPRVHMWAAG